jgi:hypothetical protein
MRGLERMLASDVAGEKKYKAVDYVLAEQEFSGGKEFTMMTTCQNFASSRQANAQAKLTIERTTMRWRSRTT